MPLPPLTDPALAKLYAALALEIDKHYGKIHLLETHLGKGNGYLSRLTSRKRALTVDRLFEVLRLLGLDPAMWLTEVFTRVHSSDEAQFEAVKQTMREKSCTIQNTRSPRRKPLKRVKR